MKDLTNSTIARQNILNNAYAIEEIQKAVGVEGIAFENQFRFLKAQIAVFFEVDERTIERYLEAYDNELKVNGYEVLKGNRLKEFILACQQSGVGDINVAHKTRNLGIFNFRSFINLGMLLTESEKASTRNKQIAEVFYLTNDIEKYGSGFIRIRKSIAEYPTMKFSFTNLGHGFLTELSYENQKTTVETTVETTKKKLLKAISHKPEITQTELMSILNLSRRGVEWYINNLKNNGQIKRTINV